MKPATNVIATVEPYTPATPGTSPATTLTKTTSPAISTPAVSPAATSTPTTSSLTTSTPTASSSTPIPTTPVAAPSTHEACVTPKVRRVSYVSIMLYYTCDLLQFSNLLHYMVLLFQK